MTIKVSNLPEKGKSALKSAPNNKQITSKNGRPDNDLTINKLGLKDGLVAHSILKMGYETREEVKYLACIDKLKLTIETDLFIGQDKEPIDNIKIGNDVEFVLCGHNKNYFKNEWKVYFKGEPFAMIYTNHRNSLQTTPLVCSLWIDNHKLYQDKIVEEIDEFLGIIEGRDTGVSAYDIAIDTDLKKPMEFLQCAVNKTYKQVNRAKTAPVYDNQVLTGFYYGGKKVQMDAKNL